MRFTDADDPRTHYVYRLFGHDGELHYIGCTYDIDTRLALHHVRIGGTFTTEEFSVRRARRDVARLLGERVPGKRRSKPRRQPDWTPTVATKPRVTTARAPKRLPWEDQPDDFDRGLDWLMRQSPR